MPGDVGAAQRMAAAARGDAVAFIELCESYAPALLGATLRILGDRVAAESTVYGVLLDAWRGAKQFDPRQASVRVWWTIGARSAALRALPEHRAARMAAVHDTQITTLDDKTEAPDVGPLRQAVQTAMLDLDDEPRSALQLAYFEGLGAGEIADRARTSPEVVRAQVADGLRRLSAALAGIAPSIDVPRPHDRLAAAYLLDELSLEDRARFDRGEALGELQASEVAAQRDNVHGLALYTFPAALLPQTRARLVAAIAGPERLSPFTDDLAALLRLPLHDAREILARVDAPAAGATTPACGSCPSRQGPKSVSRRACPKSQMSSATATSRWSSARPGRGG
ncbi:RNA polymerase sigma factor [Nannocystis pusilla]|uniref:RNA polymerase sigma factor n=1 Tax=Nannocystis pusilla TaxID=889268 RepID=UPI003B7EAC2C